MISTQNLHNWKSLHLTTYLYSLKGLTKKVFVLEEITKSAQNKHFGAAGRFESDNMHR